MSIIIPCSIAIGIFGSLIGYQIHLARIFVGNYKDKLYYYYSHLITVIPLVLYSCMIADQLMVGNQESLIYFYVEWIFTTPMILINLARLIHIPLTHYILIVLTDMTMVFSGYISFLSTNTIVIYSTFVYACLCFCALFTYYLQKLKVFRKRMEKLSLPPTSIYRDSIRYRIYRAILISVVCSWILYPLGHILYKSGSITVNQTVIWYVCLDVATKGIFTNLLLGSRELYKKSPLSFLGILTKKLFQIHPLEIKPSDTQIEEILEAKKEVPIVTIIPEEDDKSLNNISHIKQIQFEKSIDRELFINNIQGISGMSSSSRKLTVYEPELPSISENNTSSSSELPPHKTVLHTEEL